MDSMTDERLMELLKRGESRALDELYRRHARRLFVFLRSATGLRNRQDCEDAVHDVFLRVIRGAEGFDPARASFRTWVARIARNLSIDVMRRREKAKIIPIDAPADADTYGGELTPAEVLSDQGEDPEASYRRSAAVRAVRDCIGKIENDAERQAIVLYYLYDKVYREVGEVLGESTSMARNRIKAAQTKVKDCLERKGITGS
jgi:RNA polymerase sigma-70 factor (ECF subfamily)